MNILGISCYYHDAAATLVVEGKVVASAQEERFSRIKNDSRFPARAISFCLSQANITLKDVDAVVFYENPQLKFRRIVYSYFLTAPKGFFYFLVSLEEWLFRKLRLKQEIRKELQSIAPDFNGKLLFAHHHLSHAAASFFTSQYNDAAILTIDGIGESTTAAIYQGRGNRLKLLKELRYPDSLGLLYSAVTYFLGFKVNSGEYKIMGLAPYGNRNSSHFASFKDVFLFQIVSIHQDGSIRLNQRFFNYFTGTSTINEQAWAGALGISRRTPETELLQYHCDLALVIQDLTNDIVTKMAAEARKLTGSVNICLGGGVALNCVSNTQLLKTSLFESVHIHPASGDAGGALGAALAAHHIYFGAARSDQDNILPTVYLGPEFTDSEIRAILSKNEITYTYTDSWEELYETTAQHLADGKVIGWFQDRMEWGPRALGNRSILADPGNAAMQTKLNIKIKHREGFRPFAPAVTAEEALNYFDMPPSPYMLYVTDINPDKRRELPHDFQALPLAEKLYYIKSDLPAITHIDFSCRAQVVSEQSNKKFWSLINAFRKHSGYPVLINTSMNVRGEPIVCTPEDALGVFKKTDMDLLVIHNYVIDKRENPQLATLNHLVETFALD